MDLNTRIPLFGSNVTPLQILAGIGFFSTACTVFNLLQNVRFALYSSSLARYRHPSKSASPRSNDGKAWALVTGSSSGIGEAFAAKLAAQGFNVILHGRNERKLQGVIDTLSAKYPTASFKTLVLDASRIGNGEDFDTTVLKCVADLNLTVVVHNLGGSGHEGYEEMKLFEHMTTQDIDSTIDINARFALQLTRVLLPGLIKNQPALILFISSAAALLKAPYVSLYSGQKSCLNILADALRLEFEEQRHDIEVKSVIVATVVTATSNRSEKDRGFDKPMPLEFVDATFSKVGYNSAVITPWLGHRVGLSVFSMLPRWLADKMLLSVTRDAKEGMDALKDKILAQRSQAAKKAE